MPTPETNHHRWTSVVEHLKNPAELLVLTAIAYAVIMIGSSVAVPALNNLVEILNKATGR